MEGIAGSPNLRREHGGRFEAGFEFLAEAGVVRFVGSGEFGVAAGFGDALLHAKRPEDAVEGQFARGLLLKVSRVAECGEEHAALAMFTIVVVNPGDGVRIAEVFAAGIGTFNGATGEERGGAVQQGGGMVKPAAGVEGLDTAEHRVGGVFSDDGDIGRVFAAVVADPWEAEDLVRPFLVHGIAAAIAEGVGGGSETGHRLAALRKGGDVFQLVVRQIAEAGIDDHHVGLFEDFETFDVVGAVRIDDALRESETDTNGKSVVAVEDAGEHGHCLLGAVFLVACDEDEVRLAFPAFEVGDVGGDFGGNGGEAGHGDQGHGGKEQGGRGFTNHCFRECSAYVLGKRIFHRKRA